MNELRLVKFQTLIEDISKTFTKNFHGSWYSNEKQHPNLALRLIFDYDECNEYARIIIDKSLLYFTRGFAVFFFDDLNIFASLCDNKCDTKTRISVSKEFVKICREEYFDSMASYRFIFWALLVLTVDKNNAQEYLSLICDFAKMLKITNDEFEDIINVIKCVYNVDDKNYTFKTKRIPEVFDGVLNLYSD